MRDAIEEMERTTAKNRKCASLLSLRPHTKIPRDRGADDQRCPQCCMSLFLARRDHVGCAGRPSWRLRRPSISRVGVPPLHGTPLIRRDITDTSLFNSLETCRSVSALRSQDDPSGKVEGGKLDILVRTSNVKRLSDFMMWQVGSSSSSIYLSHDFRCPTFRLSLGAAEISVGTNTDQRRARTLNCTSCAPCGPSLGCPTCCRSY